MCYYYYIYCLIGLLAKPENFPQENNDENIDENHKNQTVQATNIMSKLINIYLLGLDFVMFVALLFAE